MTKSTRSMSTIMKVVLGAASVWPLIYIATFMLMFVFLVRPGGGFAQGADPFRWLFTAHFFTMFVIIALLVFYIRDVFQNSALPDAKRSLWAIVLFLGSPIAMPVYWWYYIWLSSTPNGKTGAVDRSGAV